MGLMMLLQPCEVFEYYHIQWVAYSTLLVLCGLIFWASKGKMSAVTAVVFLLALFALKAGEELQCLVVEY